MPREEITALVRVGPGGVSVIIRKAQYCTVEDLEQSHLKKCSECAGGGVCVHCGGRGVVGVGSKGIVELLSLGRVTGKFGLTNDGGWILVPDGDRYPAECFMYGTEILVGKDGEPCAIIPACDAYDKLTEDE